MRNLLIVCGLALGDWGPAAARGQNVPATVVADGVPALPDDLARALSRYQNARSAAFQGWVGDRREVLILTRFADTPQVHHVAFPGGARTQRTFLKERVLDAAPHPCGDQFVYSTDAGGAENYQLVLAGAGTERRFTDARARNVLGRWSHTGRALAFSSNARNGKDMDLYAVNTNPRQLLSRLVKEVSGSWSVADWSPDDRRVAAVEYVSISESYVHLVDAATGEAEAVTPRRPAGEPTVSYAHVRWSKDGKSLYWTSDLDSEFRRLARYDLASRAVTPLSAAIPWDVEEFDLSDDGRMIVFSANEDGVSVLHGLDAATGRKIPVPGYPMGQISGLAFRRGSHEIAFTQASARAPGDVYSLDLDGPKRTRWTRSETGGLDPERFAEPELIHFPSFDGRQIPAFVYRPDPAQFRGPRPVLITIHGGPESQFRPGFLGWSNYLVNELGVALVFPNVRGSAGYGKSYLRLDNGPRREDAVKDIGALLDWVGTRPELDAKRVAVSGGSYGGYMALACLTHYSDRLRAGIDVVGISNFLTFLKNTQDYRRDLRRAEYGDERDPKMRAHLEAISPLTRAADITVPLLIAQGKNDPRVPVTESEQMLAAVRKNGRPVWYVLGTNEGHGFAKKPNADYLQGAEALFLKTYLVGD